MNVLIAMDSFKGSLTSIEAGMAAKDGILMAVPSAFVTVKGIADGGEGTVDALIDGMNGKRIDVKVTGPLGELVDAYYGIIDSTEDSRTAIIEMALAASLAMVPDEKRNPLYTTTYGVGEIIKDAINKGCTQFVIGIGGSATNDGGLGMLSALGFKFLDTNDLEVGIFGRDLENITRIDAGNVDPILKKCVFKIACDVTNPLCAENGCSAVYGPQKGLTEYDIKRMDKWLSSYAKVTKEYNQLADPDYPGAGAAGGLGFAFRSYLGASLESGIKIIMEETRLEDYISQADYVVTGEGRIDVQSAMGKTISGIASLAKKYNKKVIAFAGSVSDDIAKLDDFFIDAVFPVTEPTVSLAEAMKKENAIKNIKLTAEKVFSSLG